MQLGGLNIQFHRTVRVEGKQPNSLPPSLGRMELHSVNSYRCNCPHEWDPRGVFLGLYDTEAMWIDFQATPAPRAVALGIGGINALTGEKLQVELVKDGYLVCPPNPWIDGWKNPDGTVSQFVATPYTGGTGKSVGEQLLGADSKSGGLGMAVYHSRQPLQRIAKPPTTAGLPTIPLKPGGTLVKYSARRSAGSGAGGQSISSDEDDGPIACAAAGLNAFDLQSETLESTYQVDSYATRRVAVQEMGVGKGGAIIQKIIPDPYGLEVWQPAPLATLAIYLIPAEDYRAILGKELPLPRSAATYAGPWFQQQDAHLKDVPGSPKFQELEPVIPQPVGSGTVFPK